MNYFNLNKTIFFAGTLILLIFAIISKEDVKNQDISLIINKKIEFPITHVFSTPSEIKQGLSGVDPDNFSSMDIALFIQPKFDYVRYWMPNTLFPLSIIFIDNHGLIVGVENLDNFPEQATTENRHLIPITGSYEAKYVLEVKQDSTLIPLLVIGNYVSFKGL